MYTLLQSKNIRCRNCQHVGKSKVNNYYRALFLFLALIILPLTIYFLIHKTMWELQNLTVVVITMVGVVGVFISPNAHSCEKCGSTYLREIKDDE